MRRLLIVTLVFAAGHAAAQASVKLPRTQGEIRALLRETGDPICPRCGIITSVRAVDAKDGAGNAQAAAGSGRGALDPGLGTVPLGGGRAKAEREQLVQTPGQRFEVIVRYDDGSYGRFDLSHDPGLPRGTRVKVEGNAIERYP
jgi:hypothetical protein